ncbi:MAG: Cache, type 2 domain protein [Deltaproteobacteria bacterium]|nr:Cache, type 2 domain protein [Deltaproteobacteria bacterium]
MLTQPTASRSHSITRRFALVTIAGALGACGQSTPKPPPPSAPSVAPTAQLDQRRYERAETRNVVALVNDAAKLIQTKGDSAFAEFRVPASRWRQGETYVFVLDPAGNMLVHPDPTMEGKNMVKLEDVNGRPIIRGLIDAATALPDKPRGWYHYQWRVPGALLPRWKSSYVRLVEDPSGRRVVVGSGIYDDRMERAFVVDIVKGAVGKIEKLGETAFPLLRDPSGPFRVKDAYVFVVDPNGVELVNPAFPNLEGRNVLDVKDTQSKYLVREMLAMARTRGSGWVDYLWPKPGDSVSTLKSTYVSKARIGDTWLLVACGVYLADAPEAAVDSERLTAPELVALVREGAAVFERRGDDAYPEFRRQGSKWFRDDTYFIVYSMDGTRTFNAPNPAIEGQDARVAKDIQGRPYGKMFFEVGASPSGEGWVHYLYPEPGNIFPTWKSVFLKRVTFPSGKPHLVGAGIYNMQMDKLFVVDLVDRAVALIAQHGTHAFAQLRDKTGPFVFMDTYVFVDRADGLELVNPAQPSLEGTNLIDVRDVNGKPLVREYIAAALKDGSAWVDYSWYKPGHNIPARKQAYVRTVRAGRDTYVVGSGIYLDD